MPKHKAITIDALADEMLKKHPTFNGIYQKKYEFDFGTEHVLASAVIRRDIHQWKDKGRTFENNSDEILIWDRRGKLPYGTEGNSKYLGGAYTGNTDSAFVKLSVRTSRKDLGLLAEDIDYAVDILKQIKAEIKEEVNKLNKKQV
tara:strand:+ start:425 stop:859 length:435 start_codon:yes stop_codon:yes gene_type:complete